jgi:UDP:flavonoid glycosyltransferase YjiC (YdhE family)
MSLRDLVQTDVMLADVPAPRVQAPIFTHIVHGVPSPSINLAEILLTCGYLNSQALQGLFTGWRGLLGAFKPDLVVGDYSPTAMLAARSLGIPSTGLAIGFYLPSPDLPMPSLRDWERPQPQRMVAAEQQMLKTVNTVLARTGSAPLTHAAQAIGGDFPVLLTWPELDHYGRTELPPNQRWWGPSMSPQGGVGPQWPAGDPNSQPAVFAYLKAGHPDHAAVLKALVALGCRTVCYMPEVASGKAPPVVSPLIHYASGPVHLAAALADAQLCICHAGEATLAQSMLAKVPVFLMPTTSEQYLIARQVAKTGAAVNAAAIQRPMNYEAAIAPMLGESSYRTSARKFAEKYAHFSPHQHTIDLVDTFEKQMG